MAERVWTKNRLQQLVGRIREDILRLSLDSYCGRSLWTI